MTESTKTIVDNEIIKDFIITNLDYIVLEKINEGHMGLPIFRCIDDSGGLRVIKIGVGAQVKQEIDDNLHGYTSIVAAGAEMIVPENIKTIDTPWGRAIDLPDLGQDFTKSSTTESKTRKNYEVLDRIFLDVIKKTRVHDRESHLKGVVEAVSQVQKWSSQLIDSGIATADLNEIIVAIDPHVISGTVASVMILDFTPDNIFINNGSIKFIDPWRQKNYLGTPLPALAQFITLAESVYKIPGFNEEALNYSELVQNIGKELELNPQAVAAQVYLGRALQFSLSSYVRISSNPEFSRKYAKLSRENIEKITHL